MRIVWSRRAVLHLNAIREYIERDSPEAAQRLDALRNASGSWHINRCWADQEEFAVLASL